MYIYIYIYIHINTYSIIRIYKYRRKLSTVGLRRAQHKPIRLSSTNDATTITTHHTPICLPSANFLLTNTTPHKTMQTPSQYNLTTDPRERGFGCNGGGRG